MEAMHVGLNSPWFLHRNPIRSFDTNSTTIKLNRSHVVSDNELVNSLIIPISATPGPFNSNQRFCKLRGIHEVNEGRPNSFVNGSMSLHLLFRRVMIHVNMRPSSSASARDTCP